MIDIPKPRKMHLNFLEIVRAFELEAAVSYFPKNTISCVSCRLLEVGAGTGAQAQRLSELGYAVSALDIRDSSYRDVRCFDIVEYDGINIPLPDTSYDVVFSSHVLEHVIHLDQVLSETHRVLADDGICVHLIPTSSCRAWTLISHYIWLARRTLQKLLTVGSSNDHKDDVPRIPSTVKAWFWTLFPARHGERGGTVTEIYYYSRRFWREKFEKNNFQVIQIDSNNLFYTMANSVGPGIGIPIRRHLARFFGSACHIYVLKKRTLND